LRRYAVAVAALGLVLGFIGLVIGCVALSKAKAAAAGSAGSAKDYGVQV
jgi:hypothetical protein